MEAGKSALAAPVAALPILETASGDLAGATEFFGMARLVMKFGGTSVGDIDRIRNVARHVRREVDHGNEVAGVGSAMAGETN